MKVIDISWTISNNMTTYKDNDDVAITPTKIFEKDNVREHKIIMGTHTGTHVDAGTHFLAESFCMNDLLPEHLMGNCLVVDLSQVEDVITQDLLEQYDFAEYDVVVFKTRNSEQKEDTQFDKNFVYLDKSAADYLVEHSQARVIGIDYLGIERNQPDHETHKTFFVHEMVVVEGLRLAHVQEGEYFFVCLPLKIKDVESAPARAVLIEGL
jgi:arylformamidase